MKEDIDEIMADYLNKEELTDGEKQEFEAWKYASLQNEKVGKIIHKLEHQKKILNRHQKKDVVFAKIERQVHWQRKKRKLILWSSCAAAIGLVTGLFFTLKWEESLKKEATLNQTYICGLTINKPAAELILPNGNKRLLDSKKTTIILSDSTGEIRTDQQTLIVETRETQAKEPEFYTMNIPYGAEFNLVLPDGTKIHLNAGTTLRYPDRFTGEKREVFLSGEAYFEVASDSLHPFTVHTADVTIRVLGTSFNVNAYSEDTWIKTTLVEGRVETSCGDKSFIMTPGTQVAYNKVTRDADCFPVNTQHFISWKDGYHDFEGITLEELVQIFSRWYNVRIEFASPELKNVKFSGRLKRYDDFKALFDMLEYTRDVKFVTTNDRIIIQNK